MCPVLLDNFFSGVNYVLHGSERRNCSGRWFRKSTCHIEQLAYVLNPRADRRQLTPEFWRFLVGMVARPEQVESVLKRAQHTGDTRDTESAGIVSVPVLASSARPWIGSHTSHFSSPV